MSVTPAVRGLLLFVSPVSLWSHPYAVRASSFGRHKVQSKAVRSLQAACCGRCVQGRLELIWFEVLMKLAADCCGLDSGGHMAG